jgi:hypothetical protein
MIQATKNSDMIQSVAGIVNHCIQQALSAQKTIRAVYLFDSVLDELHSGKQFRSYESLHGELP